MKDPQRLGATRIHNIFNLCFRNINYTRKKGSTLLSLLLGTVKKKCIIGSNTFTCLQVVYSIFRLNGKLKIFTMRERGGEKLSYITVINKINKKGTLCGDWSGGGIKLCLRCEKKILNLSALPSAR